MDKTFFFFPPLHLYPYGRPFALVFISDSVCVALTVFVSAAYHLSMYKQWDTVTVTATDTDTSPCIGLYEEIMMKLQFRVRAFYDISVLVLDRKSVV